MEINLEHILDCLEGYQKRELTRDQVNQNLSIEEKIFLMNQDVIDEETYDYDVLDWLDESTFFMIVEVNERLCCEAESVLEELGVEVPVAIELFLRQLIETKQLPVVPTENN